MNLEIIHEPLSLNIFGFSSVVLNKDYGGTAFRLMDRMWQIAKSTNLKNKGLNVWVYEPGEKIFAGVELDEIPKVDTGLEHKNITLGKYAFYKHIGPYNLIKQAGITMSDELKRQGYET